MIEIALSIPSDRLELLGATLVASTVTVDWPVQVRVTQAAGYVDVRFHLPDPLHADVVDALRLAEFDPIVAWP